jgi:hypothetical protein
MDPGLAELVDRLRLPHLTAVDVRELELADPELAAVRSARTWPEYCFTATPSICRHSLQSDPKLAEITYLDADLMFFADPEILFAEIGGASCAIVPHRFSSRWAHCEATHGTFNVAFNSFRRDQPGLAGLDRWRERCLEWCHLRFEPGRYGDQVYLDEFPRRFAAVHVLEHPGADAAPWNTEAATVDRRDGDVYVGASQLIFYHFASMQLYRGGTPARFSRIGDRLGWALPALRAYRCASDGAEPIVWRPFPGYRLSAAEIELIWEPYIERLLEAMAELRAVEPGFRGGIFEATTVPLMMDIARGSVPGSLRRVWAWWRRSGQRTPAAND